MGATGQWPSPTNSLSDFANLNSIEKQLGVGGLSEINRGGGVNSTEKFLKLISTLT